MHYKVPTLVTHLLVFDIWKDYKGATLVSYDITQLKFVYEQVYTSAGVVWNYRTTLDNEAIISVS